MTSSKERPNLRLSIERRATTEPAKIGRLKKTAPSLASRFIHLQDVSCSREMKPFLPHLAARFRGWQLMRLIIRGEAGVALIGHQSVNEEVTLLVARLHGIMRAISCCAERGAHSPSVPLIFDRVTTNRPKISFVKDIHSTGCNRMRPRLRGKGNL